MKTTRVKGMAKNIRTLFALLVITLLQLSYTWHTAEHGVLEHSHAGQVCDVCTIAKHPTLTPNSINTTPTLSINTASYNDKIQTAVPTIKINAYTSRAPPYFS